MAKEHNLFNCPTFVSTWNKHFNSSGKVYRFDHLSNVAFIKSWGNLYVNVGKRITQGIAYSYNPDTNISLKKNQTFLIYDVPSFTPQDFKGSEDYALRKIKQYDGYAIDLSPYKSASEYFEQHFKSKNKWTLKKAFKKFEKKYNLKQEVLYGPHIDPEKYNEILSLFNDLTKRRYESKKEDNIFLRRANWNYILELIFKLIKEKKAIIFILYADQKPVSIHINYLTTDSLILAYPVFDIDYSDYKIGHYTTYLSLEWCFANNIDFYDFSKGHFDYKKRWSNLHYDVEYHIIYNKSNFGSTLLARILFMKYSIKFFLRKSKLDSLYNKFKYKF